MRNRPWLAIGAAATLSFSALQPSASAQAPTLGGAEDINPPLPDAPAPDNEAHPANQPLDPLQQGLLLGVHHQTRASHPEDAAELLPKTQGEASDFIRSRIRQHFGSA
jgi:hypothetical protein